MRRWIAPAAALLLACPGAWAAANGVFPSTPVGTAATPITVNVTASATGTVANVEVLTGGAPGLDFTAGTGTSTCATNLPVIAGVTTCTESVAFTPSTPGMRAGAVVLLDGSGNVLGTAYLSGIGEGGLGVLTTTQTGATVVSTSGNILPFAGDGGYKNPVVDGIAATSSELFLPSGVAVDGAGNVYIADTSNNRIRMVCVGTTSPIAGVTCPAASDIETIAGNGTASYTGDGGPAANATVNEPSDVAVDGAGNIYIADTGNNVVRMISPGNGWITTVAGNNNGTAGYQGDGTSATSANTELTSPNGIALDASGNLYIADTGNNVVRMVCAGTTSPIAGVTCPAAGDIVTVAGAVPGPAGYGGNGQISTSASVELDAPNAVALDSAGDLYIADTRNNIVREVSASTGKINTIAGAPPPTAAGDAGDGGLAISATLNAPSGLAVDPAGNVYIADTQNNAIRKVSAASGDISTFAVNGKGEYYYTNAAGKQVFGGITIHEPNGLALDAKADLFFADTLNLMVREIQSNFTAIDLTGVPEQIGDKSATYSQTVEDDGNAALTLTPDNIQIDPNGTGTQGQVNAVLIAAPTSPCPPTNTEPFLAATNDICVVAAQYAPSLLLTFGSGVSEEPVDSNIFVGSQGDTANSPLDIEMVGIALPLNATQVTLNAAPNPSYYSQPVTFTAKVTTGTGSLSSTGTVTFTIDGVAEAPVPVTASGLTATATYTTTATALAVGTHTITAVYNGDPTHYASTVTPQSTVTQVVNEFTATAVTASASSPSPLGTSVTFTATVTDKYNGGVPLAGTVDFTDNGAPLCTGVTLALNAGTYTAQCVAPALSQGTNSIVATYSGDPGYTGGATPYILGSTSTAFSFDIQGATTLTLTPNPASPSNYGQTVTFTATIPFAGTTATGATGTVKVFNGATQIGTITLAGDPATGTLLIPNPPTTTAALPVGTLSITATYEGDTNYSSATAGPIAYVVNPAPTTTTISPGTLTVAQGASVKLTAKVTTTQSVTLPITGNITFTDTNTLNGNITTLTLACAPQPTVAAPTCTLTTLPLGTNSITATYAGDTDDAPSTSATPAVITVETETISLTSNGSPSNYGSPVQFTVNIPTIGTNSATGIVNILDGTTQIGSVKLTTADAGTVIITVTTPPLPVGTDEITASYVGDTNYPAIVSAQFPQVVNQAATTTTIAASAATIAQGASVKLTATVKPTQTATALTGSVTFMDSANGNTAAALTCPGTLTAAGATYTSTCTLTSLPVGTNSIIAVYAGDPDDLGSTSSAPAVVTVVQESIDLASNANPSYYGNPVQFTITIPQIDPTAYATGTVNILDGTTKIGSENLTAADKGVITYTTTAPLPVSTVAAPDVITASYAGDANYAAITTTGAELVNQVVNQAQTATAVSAVPTTGIAGAPVAITATVTVTEGVSTPGGTVSFTDNGNAIGTATLNGGTATINPVLNAGTQNIVATYEGDTDDAPSNGSLALTVNQAATTVSVNASANPAVVLSPVTFTATVASVGGGIPTGYVTFTATPSGGAAITLCPSVALTPGTSSAAAVCTTTATALPVGTYTISAAYSGDGNDAANTGTYPAMVVEKIPTITGMDSATTSAPNPELILVATVVNNAPSAANAASLPIPGGTVTFTLNSSTGEEVGSATLDSTGVVTFIPASLPAGNFNIVANYLGDDDHAPSSSVVANLTNPATGFNMTVTPPSVTLAASQNVTINVNLSSISGYADTIGLGCASLPPGVNCQFTIPSGSSCASASATEACVTLPATSTASNPVVVALTIDTNNPLGGGTTAANTKPGGGSFALAGLFLPLSALFGCLFWRFRRRNAALLTVALVLLLGGAAMAISGCAAGFTQSTATPGTYTIEVTGTGASSNITHYQNVTLTITK